MVLCVALIGVSQNHAGDNLKNDEITTSIWLPISLALFVCVVFTFASLLARVYCNRGFSAIQFIVDSLFLYSLLTLILFIREARI